MTVSSHSRLLKIFLLIAPLVLWIIVFWDFLAGVVLINLDAFGTYAVLKYFWNNLLLGILPFWDPYLHLGQPFYPIYTLGLFNPFIYLCAGFILLGMDYYTAYMIYLTLVFFTGAIGFYAFVREWLKDERMAYLAYVLVVFSGVGGVIFVQNNMLWMFTLSAWFFYFLVKFARHFRPVDFVGMTYCCMLHASTYFPLYLGTVLCVLVIIYAFLSPLKTWGLIIQVFAFLRRKPWTVIICACGLIVAVIPAWSYLQIIQNNDIVTPGRHCAGQTVEQCYAHTMSHSPTMSAVEASWFGGLGERVDVESLFTHLDKASYFSDHMFFVSIFVFILIGLGAGVRLTREALTILGVGLVILLIALGTATPVYQFLFDRVFFFKYFRNLFFFMVFLMPLLILLGVVQLKAWLENEGSKKLRIFIIVVIHAAWLLLLSRLGDILPSMYITLVGSFVLWLAFELGSFKARQGNLLLGLLILLSVIQPLEFFYHYRQNAKFNGSCPLQAHSGRPEFAMTRPDKTEIPNCFMFKCLPSDSVNLWNWTTFTDSSGWVGYPAHAARWAFFVGFHIPWDILRPYVHHKFIAYESTVHKREMRPIQLLEVFRKENKSALVDSPTGARGDDLALEPQILTKDSAEFKIINFDVNRLEISTHFSQAKFLVYNDAFASGWKVWLDGHSEKIYRANLAFKGVWVPTGKHRIHFQYEPPGGIMAFMMVIIVNFAFGLGLVWAMVRRKNE